MCSKKMLFLAKNHKLLKMSIFFFLWFEFQ